jgi:hypothetical protein
VADALESSTDGDARDASVHDSQSPADADAGGLDAGSDDAADALESSTDGDATDAGPLALEGLVLWLESDHGVESDGGRITAWRDQSPAHADAIASADTAPATGQRTKNTLPLVSFDRRQCFLSVASGFSDFTAGLTSFVVARPTQVQTVPGWSSVRFLDFGPSLDQQDSLIFTRSGNGPSPLTELEYTTTLGLTPTPLRSSDGQVTEGAWQIFAVVSGAGEAGGPCWVSMYKNGLEVSGGTSTVPTLVERKTNLIGRSKWPAPDGAASTDPDYQGDFAEIILYARALDETQRSGVEAYLEKKWGF